MALSKSRNLFQWILMVILLSGHYLKNEKRCSNPWFALSSHAFRTEAVNWQDGYTILRAPTGEMVEKAHCTALESAQQDLAKSTKEEYMLWEFAQVSDGRS